MGSIQNFRNKASVFLEMIKFEHTLFALPFAYLGLWLGEVGLPRFHVFFWVTAAMVAMRTAAMCVNRVTDLKIDAKNPRTANWALPKKLLSIQTVLTAAVLSLAFYFFAAWMLNPLCFALSPVPLVLVIVYPHLKRITWLCHVVLGIILGIAPAAGWIASRGSVSAECWILFAAVAFWVAGFDMIYALQDVGFDRAEGLNSFPAVFNEQLTVHLTRVFHALAWLALAALGAVAGLSFYYWLGLALVGLFLVREHWLLAKHGLAKIQQIFFQMNVMVSSVLFASVWIDLAMRSGT